MDDAYLSSTVDSLGNQFQRRFAMKNIHSYTNDEKTGCLRNGNMRNAKNTLANRYRRPSLQSRLQDGKNLELCFLNQHLSEVEDNQSEDEALSLPFYQSNNTDFSFLPIESTEVPDNVVMCLSADSNFSYGKTKLDTNNNTNRNFHELQNEVRFSLKKIYTDVNRRTGFSQRLRSDSPITCTIKTSLKKVGISNGDNSVGRRRMSRQMLTKMNSYQLQSIIDDLHVHVEFLNEQLMKMLMERDELHMSRDSLLVDIDDITAYLDGKHVHQKPTFENHVSSANYSNNYNIPNNSVVPSACTKNIVISGSRFNRLTSYIRN